METVKKVLETAQEAVSTAVFTDKKSKEMASHKVDDSKPNSVLTTAWGTKISHTDDSLKVGERGPVLLEDFHFRDKMTHFDHERIPERVVHARGSGAHGYFQVYESLAELTCADFLCHPEKKTPVFVRFSTVMGSRGSADAVRDVRGWATKFYTDQGNFDIAGNNIPVFFVQDAIKFPDIVHSGKPEPNNEMPQAATAHDNFWDFISLTPESTHMIMWALSDRAIPRSYRMMQGFGVHSFVLVNKAGKRRFCKFHWIPLLGTHSLVWDEALKLNGVDPDFHRRDLWEAIQGGDFPEYELALQIVEEADAEKFEFDLLDPTKLIPEELVPLRRVGKMVLNRNPDNFFCETEQVAFCTQHLVPGIEPSNDPLLQGRMFSYLDIQISRLGGPNFQELPINKPVCPVFNNQRDGMHRMTINSSRVNYFPNRFGCPMTASWAQGGYMSQPAFEQGQKTRHKGPKFLEHYSQARLFYNSMSSWEKKHIIAAASFELGKVDDLGVREKMIDTFNHVDFELAVQVAKAIGVKPPTESKAMTHTTRSPALSQDVTTKDTIKSRRIAFLVCPGYKGNQLTAVTTTLGGFGAVNVIVGPYKGSLPSDSGSITHTAQFSYLTCKSVMFDAVVVVGGQNSIASLNGIGEAKAFINEAFKHCKPIAAIDEGVDFVAALNLPGITLADSGVVDSHGVVTIRNFADSALSFTKEGPVTFGKALFNAIAAHRHHTRQTDLVAA